MYHSLQSLYYICEVFKQYLVAVAKNEKKFFGFYGYL